MAESDIQVKFRDILEFKTEEERIEFRQSMFSLDVISNLNKLMDDRLLNQVGLAQITCYSLREINDYFSNEKEVDWKFIYVMEKTFKVKFEISMVVK